MPEKMKSSTVSISASLHTKALLKFLSATGSTSFSAMVRILVKMYVNGEIELPPQEVQE